MKRIPIKQGLFAAVFAFCIALCLSSLYALPGVKDFLPTESGQYVYYRDSTFTQPVYVGFLQYDEGNYAMRYYAPEAQSGSKEITLFFTLDTEKDYVSMTGEKIVPTLKAEDTPTLNYLHDLFYEFNAHRKKISPEKLAGKSAIPYKAEQNAEIRIFGGETLIVYDYLIPLFNIREIKAHDNVPVFTAVATGQLLSSSDNSFLNFTGIPQDTKERNFSISAQELIASALTNKAGALTVSADETAHMDGEYKAVADNLGFWGSRALMYTDLIQPPADFFKDKKYGFFHVFARSLSFGSEGVYICTENQSVAEREKVLITVNRSYDNGTGRFYVNIKIINEKESGLFTVTGFSADIDYYNSHKAYFIQKMRETSF
ncbi:hypothetical protein H0R92_05195 [Treponema sp. OMZ 840]|uniref:hypothetical protein n=1 Tax=Treponema sp. OMZ 840 TaxID=244313 RepID=UPI003D8A9668